MRQQRTLRHAIGCAGVGLHSGARVALTLRPAAEGSGIRFRRVDRPGSPIIPARVHNLVVADGRVGLEHHSGARVQMIEHLLAALSVCEIDNLLIDVSAPELPAMDGSARPFVLLIECAGTVEQDQPVPRFELLQPIAVSSSSGYAKLEPARRLELVVDVPPGMQGRPFAITVSPEACKSGLADARAASVVGAPRSDGLANDAARYEALVALGALALVPAKVDARYVARGADAALRCQLLRRLLADHGKWRLTGSAGQAMGWRHAATTAAMAHLAHVS
jgi:UDP-3-O-[3-hydroxymyristoyl] N-acetylglucosamine deacetylase